jgi:hypothetical protein
MKKIIILLLILGLGIGGCGKKPDTAKKKQEKNEQYYIEMLKKLDLNKIKTSEDSKEIDKTVKLLEEVTGYIGENECSDALKDGLFEAALVSKERILAGEYIKVADDDEQAVIKILDDQDTVEISNNNDTAETEIIEIGSAPEKKRPKSQDLIERVALLSLQETGPGNLYGFLLADGLDNISEELKTRLGYQAEQMLALIKNPNMPSWTENYTTLTLAFIYIKNKESIKALFSHKKRTVRRAAYNNLSGSDGYMTLDEWVAQYNKEPAEDLKPYILPEIIWRARKMKKDKLLQELKDDIKKYGMSQMLE